MIERMTLIDAGQALGLSPDAVRMRVKRGTMQGEKDEAGKWWVWVDTEETEAEREPELSGEREPEQGAEALRAQIEVLEARLAAAESERDFLRTQVENLIMIQGMTAQKALPNPARRWWWPFGRR